MTKRAVTHEPTERVRDRVGGISGIAALVFAQVGFQLMVSGGWPFDPDASQSTIAEFVSDPLPASVTAGIFLDMLGGMFFIVFAARLWVRLREAEGPPAWLSAVALGGAFLALAAAASDKAIYYGISAEAGKGLDPAVAQAFFATASGAFVAFGFYGALLTGAAAAVVLRTGALPRWIGWLGAAAAAGSVTGAAAPGSISQFGFVFFLAWLLATSIALLRRPGAFIRDARVTAPARVS